MFWLFISFSVFYEITGFIILILYGTNYIVDNTNDALISWIAIHLIMYGFFVITTTLIESQKTLIWPGIHGFRNSTLLILIALTFSGTYLYANSDTTFITTYLLTLIIFGYIFSPICIFLIVCRYIKHIR